MWCDVMWCNVMWCDVMWCGLIDMNHNHNNFMNQSWKSKSIEYNTQIIRTKSGPIHIFVPMQMHIQSHQPVCSIDIKSRYGNGNGVRGNHTSKNAHQQNKECQAFDEQRTKFPILQNWRPFKMDCRQIPSSVGSPLLSILEMPSKTECGAPHSLRHIIWENCAYFTSTGARF